MAEEIFYEGNGVKVTSARLIFGAQTFQMSGITSVRPQEVPPDRKGPLILFIVGLLCTGGVLSIAAVVWWFMQKTHYSVILVSAAGETPAYTSLDKNEVFQIANAVNEAMAAKG